MRDLWNGNTTNHGDNGGHECCEDDGGRQELGQSSVLVDSLRYFF